MYSNLERVATSDWYKAMEHNCVLVTNAVIELPRKDYSIAVTIKNDHANQVLYIGAQMPQVLKTNDRNIIVVPTNDFTVGYKWFPSPTGAATNEWYLAKTDGTDPGLTETTYLYYGTAGGGADTLATNGTVGSLAAQHNWDWGDNDTLGFNTLYIRSDGVTTDNDPMDDYDRILSYTFTLTADDAATTGGTEIATAGGSIEMSLDASQKIFAIASGANTPAKLLEFF